MSEIRLNMTFISLHLSEAFLKCKYDKLEVHNLKGTESEIYSTVDITPILISILNLKFFIIMIKLYLMIPFQLNAKFSVTDNRLVFNPAGYPSD